MQEYIPTDVVIDFARNLCGISAPIEAMSDEEISVACRRIGEQAPDSVWVDHKPTLGPIGIGVMLFLALTEFPEFYERFELAQRN